MISGDGEHGEKVTCMKMRHSMQQQRKNKADWDATDQSDDGAALLMMAKYNTEFNTA